MKTFLRKTFSIILALTMVCTPLFQTSVFAAPQMVDTGMAASELPDEDSTSLNDDRGQSELSAISLPKCGTNLTYNLDENGVLTISGTGAMTKWSSYSSVPWYAKRASIKSIVIEEGATNIGDYAFYDCNMLTSIEIPGSVVSIGGNAFEGCLKLTNIDLPFGLQSIGNWAFERCLGLTNFSIPDTVTSLGSYAFYYCSNLTTIDLGTGIERINSGLFSGCTKLEELHIPASVTSVNYSAISDCNALKSITVDKDNRYYYNDENGALIGIRDCCLFKYPAESSATNYTIPDGVEEITSKAFKNAVNLNNIVIPGSVKYIDYEAFSNCSGLKEITIPDSVKYLSDFAFENCTNLTSAKLGDGIISVAHGVFANCAKLSEVVLPESLHRIPHRMFQGCTALESIEIPDSVSSIDDTAFEDCVGLKSIVIPPRVTRIDDMAFFGCTNLESITIPGRMTKISYDAFGECDNLTTVYFNGSEEKWNSVEILEDGNEALLNAEVVFGEEELKVVKNGYIIPLEGGEYEPVFKEHEQNGKKVWHIYGYSDGEILCVPIYMRVGDEWIIDPDEGADITSSFEKRICSYSLLDNGMYEIFSLGNQHDDDGNYIGMNKDVSVLDSPDIDEKVIYEHEYYWHDMSMKKVDDSRFSIIDNESDEKILGRDLVLTEDTRIILLAYDQTGESYEVYDFDHETFNTDINFLENIQFIATNNPESTETEYLDILVGFTYQEHLVNLFPGIDDEKEEGLEAVKTGLAVTFGDIDYFGCPELKLADKDKKMLWHINVYIDGEIQQIPIYNKVGGLKVIEDGSITSEYYNKICNYTLYENGVYELVSVGYSMDEDGVYNGMNKDQAVLDTTDENAKVIITDDYSYGHIQKIAGSRYDLSSFGFDRTVVLDKNTEIILFVRDDEASEYTPYRYDYTTFTKGIDYVEFVSFIVSNNPESKVKENLELLIGFTEEFEVRHINSLKDTRIVSSSKVGVDEYDYYRYYYDVFNPFTGTKEENIPGHRGYYSADSIYYDAVTAGTVVRLTYTGEINEEHKYGEIDTSKRDFGLVWISDYDAESSTITLVPANVPEEVCCENGFEEAVGGYVYNTDSPAFNFDGEEFYVLEDSDRIEYKITENTKVALLSYSEPGEATVLNGQMSLLDASALKNPKNEYKCYLDNFADSTTRYAQYLEAYVYADYFDYEEIPEADFVILIQNKLSNNGLFNTANEADCEHYTEPIVLHSGICGDNLTWTLDENGLLTIKGTGDMYDYGYLSETPPWNHVKAKIKRVKICDNVSGIGVYSFYDCKNLESVVLGQGVKSIRHHAFAACRKIVDFYIPRSVVEIDSTALVACAGLKEIRVDSSNEHYVNNELGVLFNKDKTVLVKYPAGSTCAEYIIPEGVTGICHYAFYDSYYLTDIHIPDSVTDIDEHAFSYCTVLTNVEIPYGITELPERTFAVCEELKTIKLPNSITSIGEGTFFSCGNLETVYYTGTEEEWNNIVIGSDNTSLLNAKIVFLGVKQFRVDFDKSTVDTVVGMPESIVASGIIKLPDVIPERKGYHFEGWVTEPFGDEFVTELEVDKDIVLYARWATLLASDEFKSDFGSYDNCAGVSSYKFEDDCVVMVYNGYQSEGIWLQYNGGTYSGKFDPNSAMFGGSVNTEDIEYVEVRFKFDELVLSSRANGEILISVYVQGTNDDGTLTGWNESARTNIYIDESNFDENGFYRLRIYKSRHSVITFKGNLNRYRIQFNPSSTASEQTVVLDYIRFVGNKETCKHFFEETINKKATCVESGLVTKTCTLCGKKYEAYIPASGHDYLSEVTSELTCTQDGEITYTCENCGDSYSIVTKAEHEYEITSYIDATCAKDGKIVYTCSKCGDDYEKIITAAHNYVSEITKESEVGVPGIITYTCTGCGDSYTEEIPALREAEGYVLLVQDRIPWHENDNIAVLNKLVKDGYIMGYSVTTSAGLPSKNLEEYAVVVIANDQQTSTYSRLEDCNELLEEYVSSGGVVVYGACDEGWADGSLEYSLPGGVTTENSYNHYNYIVDTTHEIVKGALTDDKALSNELLYGNYTSHTYFNDSTLPEEANVILQDGSARPTLVEYAIGDGIVIASGLTWEFYWYRPFFGGGSDTTYSKNVYDDLIVYALTTSGIEVCEHVYDDGTEVEPTCTTEGYTLHTCIICSKTVKDNYVSALGHTEGDWMVGKQPSCTEEGYRYKSCSVCEEEISRESIDATGHDTETSVVTEATCTENGLAHISCKNCSYVEAVVLEALGHEFGADNKCIRCGVHRFLITVHFEYSDGNIAADDVSEYYLENEIYNVEVPEIEGYMSNMTVISGTATEDKEYTVVYSEIEAEKIVEISDVELGDVEYNTIFSELGLPATVKAMTESGKAVSLRVVWNSTDYDGTEYGKQIITGTALASYGYEIVCDSDVEAHLNICENVIVEIPEMDLGRLPLGISYEGLGLPSTAAVVTNKGSTYYLPVEWDEYSYDSSVEGKHTICGVVTVEEGFVLAEGVEADAKITFELTEKMYGTADIVFLIDTTGSMWDEIQNVKNNINMFADNLEADGVSARWALLEYRDITCDGKNSTKVIYNGSSEWYIDVNSYKSAIASLTVNGGGDREETVVDALKAATYLTDREEAVTFYIVVTDADFKVNNSYGVSSFSQMIQQLVAEETVASCVTKTTYFADYRPMTDATGGILANIDGNFASELLKLKELISDTILYGKVTGIEITKNPDKTKYYSGDRFDGSGMIITAHYESGLSREVTGYTVEPYGPLSVDVTSVVISYRGVSTELDVTVEMPMYPVTGVSVVPDEIEMRVGDIKTLKATVRPFNATNPEVLWETSNTNVVTVDEKGVIEAVGEGNATITVITADGGYTATVDVSVENYIPVTEIFLDSGSVTLEVGDEYTAVVTVYPDEATNKGVNWMSSNSTVANVNNGRITAMSVGTATITAVSKDSGVRASMLVTVIQKKPDYYTVTYNAGEGEGAPENQIKNIGEDLTLSEKIPTCDGFEFEGWAVRVGGAPVYAPGDEYTQDRDLNLYAVWVKILGKDTSSHVLFNSGRTGSAYKYPGAEGNYDESSLTNGGFDLYARAFDKYITPIRLGTSIRIDRELAENAILTIYSYDVDENGGERDIVYLVDEDSGEEVKLTGYLHGMDCQWNSTTLIVPKELFEVGHTYYFKLYDTVSDWHVWVRNVTLQLTDVAPKNIVASDFEATISATGKVQSTLYLATEVEENYYLEYAAINNHNQYGSAFAQLAATPDGTLKNVAFDLEGSAPKGEYTVIVTVKDSVGDIVMTLKDEAEYNGYNVTYNANGGTGRVPSDAKVYGSGETVYVSFNDVPLRRDYVFMGWAYEKNAETPDFSKDSVKSFTITKDVVLYAVWMYVEDNTPVISVDSKTVTAGDKVTLEIHVKNNPGVAGLKLELDYADELVLTGAVKGDALTSLTYVPSKTLDEKPYILLYYAPSSDMSDGCIATLEFSVPEITPEGVYGVDIECKECYNSELEKVEFVVIDGSITVSEVVMGDSTGDGTVDIRDVILLSQFCAGWESAKDTVNMSACDTNGDGTVDIRDVILLAQFCAGWHVELG